MSIPCRNQGDKSSTKGVEYLWFMLILVWECTTWSSADVQRYAHNHVYCNCNICYLFVSEIVVMTDDWWLGTQDNWSIQIPSAPHSALYVTCFRVLPECCTWATARNVVCLAPSCNHVNESFWNRDDNGQEAFRMSHDRESFQRVNDLQGITWQTIKPEDNSSLAHDLYFFCIKFCSLTYNIRTSMSSSILAWSI